MELIGAIESLDDLFELAVLSAFGVLVGQADDGAALEWQGSALKESRVIDGMDGRVIGRIAVAHELGSGVLWCGSDGFRESDEGMLNTSGVGEVVSVDCAGGGADSEPGVIPAVGHADVGFITGDARIDRTFVMTIERVAEDSGLGQVVQDRDVRDTDAEDMLEHVGAHARTQAIRHGQGQNEAKSVETAVNTVNSAQGRGVRRCWDKVLWIEVVLAVLVAEFELTGC